MKKKFRQITVDGDDSWAWVVEAGDDYYDGRTLVIWKDRQRVTARPFDIMTVVFIRDTR